MTRTEQLNQLFDEWMEQNPGEAQRMCLDGIVCEERYENTNPKILFIAKEPNHQEGPGFDFREWWRQEGVRYRFSKRLCEWAYGIWREFPPFDCFDGETDEYKSDIMRSIAFMNLKKAGGGNQADPDAILAATQRDQVLLRRQIEIIEPNIVVGGVGRDRRIWPLLFPGIESQDSGFGIDAAHVVVRERRVLVIDFYHPSYRVPRAMLYCLLGRVFQTIQA